MRLFPLLFIVPIAALASPALAQDARLHVARGDSAQSAFDPEAALAHYEAAIAIDSADADALGKASRSAVDLAESLSDAARRKALFQKGEQLARLAVEADSGNAESWFHLARAQGRAALSVGVRDRVKYAVGVREAGLKALALSPDHAGALHVLGMWNAEVKRLSGFELFFARRFLGGGVLGQANWQDAVRYMERAVQVDPDRLTHRLDLAGVYADVKETAKARAMYESVTAATTRTDFNDALYKRQAEERLKRLK
jgi:tetratricopeptide (TPR) repeat protein